MWIHLNHNVMEKRLAQRNINIFRKIPRRRSCLGGQNTINNTFWLEWSQVFGRTSFGAITLCQTICEYHWLVCFKRKTMMLGTEWFTSEMRRKGEQIWHLNSDCFSQECEDSEGRKDERYSAFLQTTRPRRQFTFFEVN